jgi:HSP20 family protein
MIKSRHVIGLERFELERLRDRIGRLYAVLEEATVMDAPASPGEWIPPVDVFECEQAVVVRVELPGVLAEQIKIGLTNTHLRVNGDKKRHPTRSRIISHHCSERSYGAFSRTVPLRWTIDVGAATAELSDGVLIVRLPKRTDRRGTEFRVPITLAEE